MWFGDQNILSEDPPTGNVSWTYCGEHSNWTGHSPSRCIDQFNSPAQSFLYFDPPVRSVSFWYASDLHDGRLSHHDTIPDDAFYYRASDTLGFTVAFDSIRANQDPLDSWANGFPRDDWTRVSITAGDEDRIYRLYFDGLMIIDDLVIARGVEPVLTCSSPVRGGMASCGVDITRVDSVSTWRFEGLMPPNLDLVTVVDDSSATMDWEGTAALTGLVTVSAFVDDSLLQYTDSLIVQRRDLSEEAWKWNSKWDYTPDEGLPCRTFQPWHHPGPDTLALSTSTEDCEIDEIGPRINDPVLFEATYRTDSIPTGPNAGLIYVDSAFYHMHHGSYKNPYVQSTAAGDLVTSSQNLKDCRQHYGNVGSLSLNIHEFNLNCTKGPAPAEFQDWWDAVERHEGRGTPGKGPNGNGHQAQRELAAAEPLNDPYQVAEGFVRNSSLDLRNFMGVRIAQADNRISQVAGDHSVVHSNFGTWDNQRGEYCGDIWVYWTSPAPAEYASTKFCTDI